MFIAYVVFTVLAAAGRRSGPPSGRACARVTTDPSCEG